MQYIKIIIALFLSISTLLFYCNVFSNTEKEMDYSKQLLKLLETKAHDLNVPYSFKIYKENDYYQVIIKSQKSQKIKKVPEAYVDKFFEQHDKSIEKNIVDIIFIPGKK